MRWFQSNKRKALSVYCLSLLLTLAGGTPLAGGTRQAAEGGAAIMLNSGRIDTGSSEARNRSLVEVRAGGYSMRLLQFVGPVQPEWHRHILETGAQIVSYIPDNSYLVFGGSESLNRIRDMASSDPSVLWEGAFLPEDKVAPPAGVRDESGQANDLFAIQLIDNSLLNAATLRWIDSVKLDETRSQYRVLIYLNIIARIPPNLVKTLALFPDVVSIQPYTVPVKQDERQCQILAGNISGGAPSAPGYLSWLAAKGFAQAQFDSSGFAVDITDSGVDDGSVTPNHFALYANGTHQGASRVVYNRLEGTPNPGSSLQGCDGHGTINAHIAAGYIALQGFPHVDGTGYHPGLGVNPFVQIGSSVVFDPYSWTYPNFPALQSRAYASGARISSNSWGTSGSGAYNIDSQAFDALVRDSQPAGAPVSTPGNQEMVILFSAGNGGPLSKSVGAPGTAKNVITVGASEGVNAFAGADGCGIDDTVADNATDLAAFSGRGPCSDGRAKPDIVAPGTHITGGVFQSISPPLNGLADFCFDASGVCGGPVTGPNADIFWPPGQQWTTASSGTSHACPAVAGGAALLRQQFINANFPPPSPAMTKALILNSARYLSGSGAAGSLWSNGQGMGMMDLGAALDSAHRVLRDQLTEDLLTATGQTLAFQGNIQDPAKPFRVTLAWTDAPGSTVGAAYKNNLDLMVSIGGNTYLGNVFSGSASTTGGTADSKNNVESVFLPSGTVGPFTVTVTAANINSDGVPNTGGPTDQDFALVITNGSLGPAPPPAGPGPVPDGRWVAGTPVQMAKLLPDGASARITWDITACPASTYAIYSGPLSSVSTYGYDSWNCSLAPTGMADVGLGTENTFFIVIPVNGDVEGSHGRDSSGQERPSTGVGHCSVTRKDISGSCP